MLSAKASWTFAWKLDSKYRFSAAASAAHLSASFCATAHFLSSSAFSSSFRSLSHFFFSKWALSSRSLCSRSLSQSRFRFSHCLFTSSDRACSSARFSSNSFCLASRRWSAASFVFDDGDRPSDDLGVDLRSLIACTSCELKQTIVSLPERILSLTLFISPGFAMARIVNKG